MRDTIIWYELAAIELQSFPSTDMAILVTDRRDRRCSGKECVRNSRYGRELGYFVPRSHYSNEAVRALRGAMTGKMETLGYWTLFPRSQLHQKEKKVIWREFLFAGRCIRCGNSEGKLQIERPFCSSCFELTRRESESKSGLQPIILSDSQKAQLRLSFRWLGKIPHIWNSRNGGTPCLSCRCTADSQPCYRGTSKPKPYLWYFGKKIPICEPCLPLISENPSHPLRQGSPL